MAKRVKKTNQPSKMIDDSERWESRELGADEDFVRVSDQGTETRLDKTLRPTVHVSIDVSDLDAGLRFYADVFGFIEKARPFPTMAILDGNNVTVCMHAKPAGSKSSPSGPERRYDRHWTPVHLDLHVQDFDATLARVRDSGGVIETEYRNQGPKPAAFCSDPFGNGFCVIGDNSKAE